MALHRLEPRNADNPHPVRRLVSSALAETLKIHTQRNQDQLVMIGCCGRVPRALQTVVTHYTNERRYGDLVPDNAWRNTIKITMAVKRHRDLDRKHFSDEQGDVRREVRVAAMRSAFAQTITYGDGAREVQDPMKPRRDGLFRCTNAAPQRSQSPLIGATIAPRYLRIPQQYLDQLARNCSDDVNAASHRWSTVR